MENISNLEPLAPLASNFPCGPPLTYTEGLDVFEYFCYDYQIGKFVTVQKLDVLQGGHSVSFGVNEIEIFYIGEF